jgi:hypothetical protein
MPEVVSTDASSTEVTPVLQEDASNNADRSSEQKLEQERTPAREEEISEPDLELMLKSLEAAAKRQAVKFSVGVDLDIEQRGAYTRFTVTIIPEIEPGIRKMRRYP